MAIQTFNNGESNASVRAKINGNATELDGRVTDAQTDADAAISGLDNKVDKSGTKVLSDNNYTTAEKTKLSGIAIGATANDTDANLKNRANHTGTQSADTITDGSTNRVYTTAEKTNVATIPTLAAASRTRRGTYANKSVASFGSRLPFFAGLSDGTVTSETSRQNHQAISAISDLQLLFVNFPGVQEVSTTIAYNDVTIEASIEYPAGTFTRVTFNNGSDNFLLKKDRQILSDYINLELPKGAIFWVRTNALVTSGQKFLKVYATENLVGSAGIISGNSVMSGTIPNSTSPIFTAALVMGISQGNAGSIFQFGDSNSRGTGDDLGTPQAYGWTYGNGGGLYGRSFKNLFPVVRANDSGQKISDWSPTGGVQSKFYGAILSTAQFAISNLGTNDIPIRTEVQIKSDYLSMWGSQKSRGIKIYQLTIPPRTTSTDAWVTVANQTVVTGEAIRVAVNDWLRDGAPITISTYVAAAIGATGSDVMRIGNALHPLAGYWELADVLESARNSGKWKANYTADGLHMNPTAHALGAAVIDTSVFTV